MKKKKNNTKDAGFRAHFYKHLLCMNATETKKIIEYHPILLSSRSNCILQIPGVWDFLAGGTVYFKLTYLIADSDRFHSNCFDVLKQLHEKIRYWCFRDSMWHTSYWIAAVYSATFYTLFR